MLKEYTLKVTVQVGGADDVECDGNLERYAGAFLENYEITHEEVVEVEGEKHTHPTRRT